MTVATDRRWTKASKCPICGGHDGLDRGHGVRCFGFLSEDREYAHCSRPEVSKNIPVSKGSSTYGHKLMGPCRCGNTHSEPVTVSDTYVKNGNGHSKDYQSRKLVATYDYRSEDGTLLYQVLRWETPTGKNFTQRRPATNDEKLSAPDSVRYDQDGSAWAITLGDHTRRVLYRLPELIAAGIEEIVVVAEGEKDCLTLAGLGMVATTNAGGKTKPGPASQWKTDYNQFFRGRAVVVIPDKDKDGGGQIHGRNVEEQLRPVAKAVAYMELPGTAKDVTEWIEAGGTADELRQLLREALYPTPRIKILTYDELMDLPELDFLFQDIIPEQSFFAVIGEQGKGKTFTMVDICCQVAVKGYQVLYIVGEGSRGIKMRVKAWSQRFNNGERIPNLFFIPQPIVPTMKDMLTDLEYAMTYRGCPKPALILFDTLAMCFVGNDNGAEEMGAFVRAVKDLGLRCEAATGVIHHTGWEGTRMAGNRKLQNAVDVEMFVSQDEATGIVSLACTKMRDGERFTTRTYKLEKVPGTKSCVVVPTGDRPDPTRNLTERQKAILTALAAVGEAGMGFMELSRECKISHKNTLSSELQILSNLHLLIATGAVGTVERRYYHANYAPNGNGTYRYGTGTSGRGTGGGTSTPKGVLGTPLSVTTVRTGSDGKEQDDLSPSTPTGAVANDMPVCSLCGHYELIVLARGNFCKECKQKWIPVRSGEKERQG